jgi:hypothetical protein
VGAIAGGHARLLALFLALLAGAVLATLLTRWTHRVIAIRRRIGRAPDRGQRAG